MCEDYPCCGHTNEDPCGRQWYDEPDAFDTTKNPHALCDHENGECGVESYDDDPECEVDYDLDLYNGHAWCYTHDQNADICEGSEDEGGETDDGYALMSAGWGTDEDYGFDGGMED